MDRMKVKGQSKMRRRWLWRMQRALVRVENAACLNKATFLTRSEPLGQKPTAGLGHVLKSPRDHVEYFMLDIHFHPTSR